MYEEQEAKRLVNKFWNLTLLSGNKNIKASNKAFFDKLEIYKGKGVDGITGFRLTQEIVDLMKNSKDWNMNEISERKQKLKTELGRILDFDPFKDYDEEDEISESTKEIYEILEKKIVALGKNIEVKKKKYYVAFRTTKNFCCVAILNNKLKVWLSLDKEELEDSKELVVDVSNIGHHGTGDSQVELDSSEKIPNIIELVKQSYESLEDEDSIAYDLDHIKDKMDPSNYETFLNFRKKLILLSTQMKEKINKYFIGYKTSSFYSIIIGPRRSFFWLKLKFLPLNWQILSEYYETNKTKMGEIRIKVDSQKGIDKIIEIVRENLE